MSFHQIMTVILVMLLFQLIIKYSSTFIIHISVLCLPICPIFVLLYALLELGTSHWLVHQNPDSGYQTFRVYYFCFRKYNDMSGQIMARYGLSVIKVPLNRNQPTNQPVWLDHGSHFSPVTSLACSHCLTRQSYYICQEDHSLWEEQRGIKDSHSLMLPDC